MSEFKRGGLHNEMTKMSLTDFFKQEGYYTEGMPLALMIEAWCSDHEDMLMDSIVPALCTCGCEVEPDGVCEHGNPSVLIELGVI